VPPAASRTQRRPSASNSTLVPSGDIWAHRIIFTCTSSGATVTGKRSAWCTLRVVATCTGMSVTRRDATSTRCRPPADQKTRDRLSGVQLKAGALPWLPSVS